MCVFLCLFLCVCVCVRVCVCVCESGVYGVCVTEKLQEGEKESSEQYMRGVYLRWCVCCLWKITRMFEVYYASFDVPSPLHGVPSPLHGVPSPLHDYTSFDVPSPLHDHPFELFQKLHKAGIKRHSLASNVTVS